LEEEIQRIKDLETLWDLFNSEGWEILQKDNEMLLKAAIESADSECDTNEKWQFRRGNIQTLRYMTSLKAITRNQLDEIADGLDNNS